MSEIDHFLGFVDRLVKETGRSETDLSRDLTGSPDTFRDARRKPSMPGYPKLRRMADKLGLAVDDIVGGAEVIPREGFQRIEAAPANLGDVGRMFRDMPQGLPVYGTALGHNIRFDDSGAADIETTLFEPSSSSALLYVARPPALVGVREAYAIYVQGDSMAPAHKNGALRFINPRAPLRIDDDVVVQLRAPTDAEGDDGEEIVSILIKTLVKRNSAMITLEQLNPLHRFIVPMERVAAIHRVMENDDLYRR